MRYLLPLLCLFFVACSSSDDSPTPAAPQASSFYVINQGSFYDGIDGSISGVNVETGEVVSDAFMTQNGVSLGNSPQAGYTFGSTHYIPAFESNRVWALNSQNLQIEGTITTNSPNAVLATQDFLFVTNNDGTLSVYNRSDLSFEKKMEVGPNPCYMAVSGNELFISISDGYNYDGAYANGFRLARVSLASLALEEYIEVGMNPGQLLAAPDGTLVVVCRGDYYMTPSQVYKVNPQTNASTYICDASFITLQGSKLLAIHSVTDWTTYESVTTYRSYDLGTGQIISDSFISAPLPAAPTAIQCAPNGEILVMSQLSTFDYTSPGFVYRYDSQGNYIAEYTVGTAPCGILFK